MWRREEKAYSRAVSVRNLRPRLLSRVFSDSPGVFATIQVADVEPSTARRRPVELAKQIADTGDESSNGVRNLHIHQAT
jgi:hypothetical protein